MKWYRKAAEHGLAAAQLLLAFMYDSGMGVPEDDAEAVRWYRKAAEQGDAYAQSSLGTRYDNGLGVSQDFAEAVRWYRKAAEQGDADAQSSLGYKYAMGQGVTKDLVQALMWFNLVLPRIPPGKKRDVVAKVRDNLSTRMTPAQIAEAQRLAREWRPKK